MRLFFYCLALLFISACLTAQETFTSNSERAIKLYEEGRKNYRLFYYDKAEDFFLKAIKADENFIEPYMVLAKLYWDIDRLEEAVEMYESGLKIDPAFYIHGFLYKGILEGKLARYDDAYNSFSIVLELEKKDEKLLQQARRGIEKSNFARHAIKTPVNFKPVSLSNSVNSGDDEYWPSLSADESQLVFTRLLGSATKTRMQEDFYVSYQKNGEWTTARNAGTPLNTADNEGAQSLSANGMVMVYTVCNRRGVIGRCDLYFSEKQGKEWSVPKNIGAPVNTRYKETQPGISADGRTIYFASDRPGGHGGLDIWVTTQDINGKWSEPVNLGDSINTPGNESSPFIHYDNRSLYFSSDYWPGMGGFDIFFSRLDNNGYWGKAKNLGYPINTHNDEIGLIINTKGNIAYYSTTGSPETGKDIFCFELYPEARPLEVSYLKGKVFDAVSNMVLRADIELYALADNKLIYKTFSDKLNGEFLVSIPTNNNYMLNVSKEGYLFFSENFSLEGIFSLSSPFYKDVPLQPIGAGKTIVLKNIFFDTDSYKLMPESKTELDKLARFLSLNKTIKVEISGHTDNTGSQQYNQSLSEKRAQSVVDYLVKAGTNPAQLTAKGYGLLKPIDSNETEEGRANNRRTELTILEQTIMP